MSTHRNIQKYRLVSSAPATAANSPSHKHVHFREIQSDEPRRRCNDSQTSWKRLSLQRHAKVLREDRDHTLLPSYTPTLSSASDSSRNSIFNTPNRYAEQSQEGQSFYRLPEDLLARGDFIAYQSGNALDFFNSPNHARPQRISEICLVNDHFMLVKIPQSHMEAIVEEPESSRAGGRCEKERREFFRCFPCQRSRRVLPVSATAGAQCMEQPTSRIRSILKSPLAHCWRVNEKPEVFNTQTTIFGSLFWKQKMPPGKVITIQPSKGDTGVPLDLRVKPACNSALTADLTEDNNNHQQIGAEVFGSPLHTPTRKVKAPATPPPPPPPTPPPPPLTLIGDPLKTSLHDTVSLEQHTAWLNDDARIDDLRQLKLATEKSSPSPLDDSKTKKKRRRGSILHWFLKRPKASKAKSKIHAVVYKTYFVRWKKPPDEMCPHCGCKRTVDEKASCKWRRCRSATF